MTTTEMITLALAAHQEEANDAGQIECQCGGYFGLSSTGMAEHQARAVLAVLPSGDGFLDALRALAARYATRADMLAITYQDAEQRRRATAPLREIAADLCALIVRFAGHEAEEAAPVVDERPEHLVVRQMDANTWSVQKKAVPGFRLSKSTMAAAREPQAGGERG